MGLFVWGDLKLGLAIKCHGPHKPGIYYWIIGSIAYPDTAYIPGYKLA